MTRKTESAESVASAVAKVAVENATEDRKAAIVKAVKALKEGEPVPVALWGKDHWSTFAYLDTRTVDYKGIPDHRHMRGQRGVRCKYPSIMAMGVELPGHSDWDCLDDIEEAGLIVNHGSGLNPLVQLTAKGCLVAAALRAHKAAGGTFASFKIEV